MLRDHKTEVLQEVKLSQGRLRCFTQLGCPRDSIRRQFLFFWSLVPVLRKHSNHAFLCELKYSTPLHPVCPTSLCHVWCLSSACLRPVCDHHVTRDLTVTCPWTSETCLEHVRSFWDLCGACLLRPVWTYLPQTSLGVLLHLADLSLTCPDDTSSLMSAPEGPGHEGCRQGANFEVRVVGRFFHAPRVDHHGNILRTVQKRISLNSDSRKQAEKIRK